MIFVPEGPNETQKADARRNQITETPPHHLARSWYAAVETDDAYSAKHHTGGGAAEDCKQREILRVKQYQRGAGHYRIHFVKSEVTSQSSEECDHSPITK